ncbi:hypothetical protein BH23ACT2_BH23ACT2_24920 [soil metagenome]
MGSDTPEAIGDAIVATLRTNHDHRAISTAAGEIHSSDAVGSELLRIYRACVRSPETRPADR